MRRTRPLALTLTGALVAGTLGALLPAGSAQAATTDPTPAKLNAAWMVSNLKDGLLETSSVYEGVTYSGPSVGTSIDLATGLKAVGSQGAALATMTAAIGAQVDGYTSYQDAVHANASAKALAFALDQTGSGTLNGVDLEARLESTVSTTAPTRGRIADQDPTPDEWFADYGNSIGQAFAAKALTQLGSAQAADVTDFLLAQQCSTGFFRLNFTADKGAADQTCDGSQPAQPVAQAPDTTALVVQQIAPLSAANPTVRTAVDKAVAWLRTQQKPDGSFVDPEKGANANTTGLAGNALRLAGDDVAAAKAASWLRSRQVVGACEPKMAPETGAVAYDDLGLADGQKHGITDPLDRTQWLVADAQALPALLAAPANAATDAVSLPRFAKVGSTATWTVEGLAAGERACLRGLNGTDTRTVVGTGAHLTGTITVAAGAQGLSLTTATTTATGVVTGLAPTTLKVKAKKKVKRGARLKVTVKGLVEGERVVVKVGKKKAKGTASANGTFTKKFRAPAKRGKATIKVTGEFADRKGTKKVRVR